MDRKLKRREFLKVSSVALLGAVAVACAPQPTVVPTEAEVPAAEPTKAPVAEATKAPAAEATKAPEMPASIEPPFLADKVASGDLPPKEERLPASPLVVTDREAIGVYGGEVRYNNFDPIWWTSFYDFIVERMLTYSEDGKTILPNVLEAWEVDPEGKVWTFQMRKGMKWSDGEPMTSEDVRFWWEDFMNDKDLNSSPWWQFRFGGEPMKVDILDDYSFRITHAAPFGNFAAHCTRFQGDEAFIYPSHYLKKFHVKYVEEAKLLEQATALKLETWQQLFNNRKVAGIWGGPDGVLEYPRFTPFNVVSKPDANLYLWERNPYYFKVDAEGNQLPYIDTVRLEYAANTEVTKQKIIQSELDIVGQHEVTMMEYPFYKENESKANFVVGDYISCMGDRVTVFPNHVPFTDDGVMDEGLSAIVQDYRWVKALSMAIDREEINQSIFFGTALMGAMCPMPSSKYYKEEYGQAWANYDVDAANALLDELGLKKGADGMRTRPDGSKLTYNLEHSGIRVGPAVEKVTEMLVGYWREVGIDATSKNIQDSLLTERKGKGQVQVTVWHADRCTDYLMPIEIDWFLPIGHQTQGGPAPKWADWYQAVDKSVEGLIEPPDDIKNLLNLFDKMTSVVDETERVSVGQEIFDYLKDNPLEIGLVLECPAPLLFNKNLRNLPKAKSYIGWDTYGLSTYQPSAFFYDGGVRA